MTVPTDEELMMRFANGEDAAFEPLFERHAQTVHAFVARMVRDPEQAHDLLQQTFLSVVRARGRYDKGTPFVPWLMTIAANAARSTLRHQKHVTAHAEQERAHGTDAVAPVETDPAMRRRLNEALQALPEQQREVVILHKVNGWSFEEIAQSLGISSGAARIRASRGYERLRALLSEVEEAA